MVLSLPTEQQVLQRYLEVLAAHGDFAEYFSQDVVAVYEGIESQRFEGREAVTRWIEGAHALEFRFVRNDGVGVPYSVIYDVADGKITALRLFFTGPIA
jgi:hypothetical protein